MPDSKAAKTDSQLLDAKAVAALLLVSTKTIQRMRDAGSLPKPVYVGRLVRWRSRDIERFINKL